MDAQTTSALLSIGGWVGTALATGAAIFERFRTNRASQVKEASGRLEHAKDDLIAVHEKEADYWKQRFEYEKAEFKEYRDGRHEADNKTNALMLRLSAENGELKAKTDVTPFMEFAKEQRLVNERLLQSIDALLKRIECHP